MLVVVSHLGLRTQVGNGAAEGENDGARVMQGLVDGPKGRAGQGAIADHVHAAVARL